MTLVIRPFTRLEAREVGTWVYAPPFDIYNGDPDDAELFVVHDDNGLGYYAVVDDDTDEVVGFCCFGREARVRGQSDEAGTLDVGGGVRPDRVSAGIATAMFPAVLEFARQRFAPERFRTAVACFNERSIRLCRSAGFETLRVFDGPGRQFQEMVLESAGDWWSQIPRRYVGAGALITNGQGEILIVEPTYKESWEIPGGVVEAAESPAAACARECAEELGLTIVVGRLLILDHQSLPGRGDSTMYVYDGGTVDEQDSLRIDAEELRSYRFVPLDEAVTLLGPRVGERVRQAVTARETGGVIELEQSARRHP